jgi:hypothetical protein
MGSALFLLGRQTESVETLETSTEAFGKALSIYHAYGYSRLRKVTERNLIRVEGLLNRMRSKRLKMVDWDDEASAIPNNQENENKEYSNPLL